MTARSPAVAPRAPGLRDEELGQDCDESLSRLLLLGLAAVVVLLGTRFVLGKVQLLRLRRAALLAYHGTCAVGSGASTARCVLTYRGSLRRRFRKPSIEPVHRFVVLTKHTVSG